MVGNRKGEWGGGGWWSLTKGNGMKGCDGLSRWGLVRRGRDGGSKMGMGRMGCAG